MSRAIMIALTSAALLLPQAAIADPPPPPIPLPLAAQGPAGPPFSATYADLAELAESAPLVVRAQVRKLARVEEARAPGLAAGKGRFYIEARTQALLTGGTALGETLLFLADLPIDARGHPPALKKQAVLLFARPVPGRPAELSLVAPDALYLADPARETQVRGLITALLAPDSPPRISGVREVINVPGALADEGETQVFFAAAGGSAASLTVVRRAGQPVRWGASFSELTADIGNPPRPGTLAWYRLACALPPALPPGTNLSETEPARAQADADYGLVLRDLGPCIHERSGRVAAR